MKSIKLRTKMMSMAIIPILVMGILISLVTFKQLSATIMDETENSLQATAEAVLAAYNQNSGDYFENEDGNVWKGGYNVSKSEKLIDNISDNTGMAVTFFYGSRRVVTSLKDKEGNRITGSAAGEVIQDKVLKKGQTYFSSRVSVEGTPYYGYYIPVYQNESDSEIVGIVFTGTQKSKVTGKIAQVNMLIGGILAVCIICTVLVVVLVSNKMVVRIKSGINVLTELADGNLAVAIDEKNLKQTDEIGELIQSTNRLKTSLASIVSGLAGNTHELGRSSEHMNELLARNSQEIATMETAITDISNSAKEQSESAQQASAGITAIDSMIKHTTSETKELSLSAGEMQRAGNQVSETLENLARINEDVLRVVEQIYQDTNLTNQAADQIREAVDVIMEIAEETSLLSLNASIEAARAGESGKGFAVVASQIQSLAEQSGGSSEKINKIVQQLSTSSNQSVQTMVHVQEVINKQSEDIRKTKEIFKSVENGIGKSIDGINQIQGAVNNLEEAKASIINLIQTLSYATRASENNTAMTLESAQMVKKVVEDLVAASNGLNEMADDITESVSAFKM